ncbi:hypothetical protein [Dactylosporangium salmoneum]|uniref:Uncharacterized protein n=1 Tax=Dactylosporangium salmoneum TaxID=53361 RepID=A0ABN3G8U7_9ACTN
MSRGDSFIFRERCGCAFGLTDVRRGVTTEDQAWRSMEYTAAEKRAAIARGVTVTREAWDDYSRAGVYDQLSGKAPCPHRTEVAS